MKIRLRNPVHLVAALIVATLLAVALNGCSVGYETQVQNDYVQAVAIQGDGKIIAAGDSYSSNSGWSIALMRYNGDGTLDTAFGNGGKVLTDAGGRVAAVAVQIDGKIVVAGSGFSGTFMLVRYNSNGSLDTTFGTGGAVNKAMNGGAEALAIQSDGKIVAAGSSYNGMGNDFALVRFNGDGSLDTSFGVGGIVRTNTSAYLAAGSGVSGVAIQADGKIVAAGGSYLVRYTPTGILDTSFAGTGMVTTGSSTEQASSVVVQADGKIVTAGSYSFNNGVSYDLALARYTSNGNFDTTFAGNGKAIVQVVSQNILASTRVALDSGGNIVAAGLSQYQSVITRYNSVGAPDTTFASGGKMILFSNNYWGSSNMINTVAFQADGKIVVAGSSYTIGNPSGYDFALARYNGNGSIDTTFGANGKVVTAM